MATVIRLSEFIPESVFTVDDRPDYLEELQRQLSSPLASYKSVLRSPNVFLTHSQSFPERLVSKKLRLTDQVQDLYFRMDELEHQITEQHNQITERDDQIATLWKEHQQQKEELLDWEIRSRIAQALNDEHVQSDRLPKDAYGLLKDRHCDYLPYLLSMWAVYKQRLPAPLLFVDGRAEDKYCAKAQELCDAHLATSIDSIWSSIHDVPRTLMISMWLTRSAYRSSVAHPTPTTVDGMSIIDSDLRLSEPEKFCAKGIIQTAKDKNNNPLFPEL